MTLELHHSDVLPAAESPSRTPQQEKLLDIWNQIDRERKRHWRDSLISMAEFGLEGEEDENEMNGIKIDDEGRIMVEIDIRGLVVVDLDALMSPGEERMKLSDALVQLLKERESANIS
ncbi:MAG: hypothetical protein Tsb009_25400 [Planctomycetaceae bacterium]